MMLQIAVGKLWRRARTAIPDKLPINSKIEKVSCWIIEPDELLVTKNAVLRAECLCPQPSLTQPNPWCRGEGRSRRPETKRGGRRRPEMKYFTWNYSLYGIAHTSSGPLQNLSIDNTHSYSSLQIKLENGIVLKLSLRLCWRWASLAAHPAGASHPNNLRLLGQV